MSIRQPSPETLQVITTCPGKSQFSRRSPPTWLHTGVSWEHAECLCPGLTLSLMSLVSVPLRRVSRRTGADPSGSHSEEGGSADCEAAAPGGHGAGGQVCGLAGAKREDSVRRDQGVPLTTHTPSPDSSTGRLGQPLLRSNSGPPAATVTGARAGTWVSSLRLATAPPKPSTSASPTLRCVRSYPPPNLFPAGTQ